MSKRTLKTAAIMAGIFYLSDQMDKAAREKQIAEQKIHIVREYKNSLDERGQITQESLNEYAKEVCIASIRTGKPVRAVFDSAISILKETQTLSPEEADSFHTKVCLQAKLIRPEIEQQLREEDAEISRVRKKIGTYATAILAPVVIAGGIVWGVENSIKNDLTPEFQRIAYNAVSMNNMTDKCVVDNIVNQTVSTLVEETSPFRLDTKSTYKQAWSTLVKNVQDQGTDCDKANRNKKMTLSGDDIQTLASSAQQYLAKNL